jgi:hypothetical protein
MAEIPSYENGMLKRKVRRELEFPPEYLDSCLQLSPWSLSGLMWRGRPRWHFESTGDWRKWIHRFTRKRAGTKRKNCKTWQLRLDGYTMPCHEVVKILIAYQERKARFG